MRSRSPIFARQATWCIVFFVLILTPLALGWWTGRWRLLIWMNLANVAYPGWALLNTRVLFHELREKGYLWVRFRDAFLFFTQFGSRAFGLPARDEAATIPGYTDDLKGLGLMASLKAPRKSPQS